MITEPIPCITVIQPWATLIAIGMKSVETRNWVRPELRGKQLGIHAASRWSEQQFRWAQDTPIIRNALEAAGYSLSGNPDDPNMLPLGAVVAAVKVHGIWDKTKLTSSDQKRVAAAALGDQDHGRFAWIFGDILRIDPPVPAVGKRGLWTWTPPEPDHVCRPAGGRLLH